MLDLSANALLGILSTLLAGTNVVTLFQLKSARRKSSAEADQEQIRSLNMIIAGNIQEISRLQERLSNLEQKYNDLYELYIQTKK